MKTYLRWTHTYPCMYSWSFSYSSPHVVSKVETSLFNRQPELDSKLGPRLVDPRWSRDWSQGWSRGWSRGPEAAHCMYYSTFTRDGKFISTPTWSATARRMSLCWSTAFIIIFCRSLAFSISRVMLSRRKVISSISPSLSPSRSSSWNSSFLVTLLKVRFYVASTLSSLSNLESC